MEIELWIKEFISSTAIMVSLLLLINMAMLPKESSRQFGSREKFILGIGLGVILVGYTVSQFTEIFTIQLWVLTILSLIISFFGGYIGLITAMVIYLIRALLFAEQAGNNVFLLVVGTLFCYGSNAIILSLDYTPVQTWRLMRRNIGIISIIILLLLARYRVIPLFILLYYGINHLFYYLIQYFNKINEAYEQHKLNAHHDFLTGLQNVRTLDYTLVSLVEQTREAQTELSSLMLDIDFFKKINDTYGHESGDIVLQNVAALIRGCCRTTDVVVRKGGEEFCVLLPRCDNKTAFKIAQRIRQAVKYHDFILRDGLRIDVTISIGIATTTGNIIHPNDLVNQADHALYQAKHSGRDCVVAYI